MNRSPFVKAITLCSFFLLISGFLIYRSGNLQHFFSGNQSPLQTSPNGGIIVSKKKNDSTPILKDSQRLTLSSSKSLILIEPKPFNAKAFKPNNEKWKKEQDKKKQMMMYSSKSGIIFSPQFPSVSKDTIKVDSSKLKQP